MKHIKSNELISYADAINLAMHEAMYLDDTVICYGLGVDDPKRIFGTTTGLVESFGKDRVFDMPTAENGMLGVGIGAALNGIKPVMVHQRLDFFLLTMDQLVNTAAKWYYMFNEKRSVPLTIRLIVGRGWGQGPTHSQNLQAWFAHVPGLKVVMPTTPNDARGMLLTSIADPNPVVFIEHRWLHGQKGFVEKTEENFPIDKCRIKKCGKSLTIVAMSYQVIEAIRAAEVMEQFDINAEVIDLCSIQPIDWETIFDSVKKTGYLVTIDTAAKTGSVSAEIVALVAEKCFSYLKKAPVRLALPDHPEPTSYKLTKDYYFDAEKIANECNRLIEDEFPLNRYESLKVRGHHDIPGTYFTGPF
jgi:pyruvate dehydrogenase E1 component beta subunit